MQVGMRLVSVRLEGANNGWFVQVCWGSVSESYGHELVIGEVIMQEARVMGASRRAPWCWYVGRAHMGAGEAVRGWSQASQAYCVLG